MFPFLMGFLGSGGSSQENQGGFDFTAMLGILGGGSIDPLRIFGLKNYPPGGELYKMFLAIGYDVDLDRLGGTINAYEIYKRLVSGDQDPLLVQFSMGTSTNLPPTPSASPLVLGPLFWVIVSSVVAYFLNKNK